MKTTLKVLVPSIIALFVASAAHAGATFDTPQGKLSIGGDVEYNVNASHRNATVTDNSADGHGTDTRDNDGRIEINFTGERVLSNGNFAGFNVSPLWNPNGGNGVEDAWVAMGVKNDWMLKVGRFEAYDLTPAGQDTWAGGYEMYKASEARGRAADNHASQMLINKQYDQFYFELSSLYGDYGSGDTTNTNTLPDDGTTYLNSALQAQKVKDPIILRPVVAWTGDFVTLALGGEFNAITDAYQTANGVDLSKRNGVGGSATFKVNDDTSLVFRGAYLDAVANNQYSLGAGVQYQNLWVAYLFGNEKIKTNADLGTTAMKADAHEVYASYKFPSVMGISNFDMYLGTYWTQLLAKDNASESLAKPTDYGSRVRFKYYF